MPTRERVSQEAQEEVQEVVAMSKPDREVIYQRSKMPVKSKTMDNPSLMIAYMLVDNPERCTAYYAVHSFYVFISGV